MKIIILATNNQGKIKELNILLAGIFRVKSMASMQIQEVEETRLSFIENALIKARSASEQSGLPALADDSGLVIDILNGAPGIYSARYAGTHGDDKANIRKVLNDLNGVPSGQRGAHFWCAMAFVAYPKDPTPIVVQCNWQGEILNDLSGEGGFGYDPIFYVPSHKCSAAELTSKTKNNISHRAKALQALLKHIKNT